MFHLVLNENSEKNVPEFDVSGGTFDMTVLTIDDGAIECFPSNADTLLQCEDF